LYTEVFELLSVAVFAAKSEGQFSVHHTLLIQVSRVSISVTAQVLRFLADQQHSVSPFAATCLLLVASASHTAPKVRDSYIGTILVVTETVLTLLNGSVFESILSAKIITKLSIHFFCY